jgi:hypothetical protein
MKVAICSHFGGFQPSYALHVGWLERAKMLKRFNVDFDFLVNEKCEKNLYPNQIECLPNPSPKQPFIKKVDIFSDAYSVLLEDYDVILTADMMYQKKGNFLAHNAAQRKIADKLKAWWCHWIHSGWVNPEKVKYPDSLRFKLPPKSFMVYLNSYELDGVQKMYSAPQDKVYAVYNPKDIRSFYDVSKLVWRITDEIQFWNKDIIQIFPFCSTRMDAKGIDGVIHVTAACKRAGKKIGLILCNSNSKSMHKQIQQKDIFMKKLGLVEFEDYIWTSKINNDKAVPRKDIADLFKMSNLFTFTSWRETVGNVFQEAMISGCQLILNENLPCLKEMGGEDAIYISSTHKTLGVKDGENGDMQIVSYNSGIENYFDIVAKVAIEKVKPIKNQWVFSLDKIWLNQMEPLLRRAYLASQGKDYSQVKPYEKWDGEILCL